MGLKILWQDIHTEQLFDMTDLAILWEGIEKGFGKVARPDTEITLSHVEKTGLVMYYPYFELLNNTMMVDKVINAEREGYDAAVMGCFGDPGLQQARGVVDMPVTGVGESGMLMAQMLGNKFATVTAGPGWVPLIEANMRRYGFGERAVKNTPVRQFDLEGRMPALFDAFRGKPEELVALFEAEALKCVEDGADVVIAGCNYVAFAFSHIGYREVADTGVPVVDPAAAAIKLAEVLADLRRTTGLTKSKCATGSYATPPRDLLDMVRKDFGF